MSSPRSIKQKDPLLDSALRPKTWDSYIGQDKIKKNIKIIVSAAKKRDEAPEHILFYGGPGLGKTTLSHIIAHEMEADIKVTSGPAIERAGDLVAILSNLSEGDVLFLDECHRINKTCEEYLYSAMEDFKLNLILGKGPMARTMELNIPHFTLIGATTRIALISSPLRDRFGATFQLSFYKNEDIEKIIQRSAKLLKIGISPQACKIIAERSRFTPRVANRLLKRARDFAQIKEKDVIAEEVAIEALEALEIDKMGLENEDRRILKIIIERFDGGPVGIQALAAAAAEEEDAILEIYEPYLMQLGLIERTHRGRMATKLTYQHLGIEYKKQDSLL
ncbi:Holliday junction branch migration DNA helicase RuvB [Candidatus Parcubacteria bacterium]|nr:Holliday junction branch migration DNA helicase RuvB [Candidatus Parcubacteria bacterium]